MCLSHSSTWDPPQHLWDSRVPIQTWQVPHLQDGAHIIRPQPRHQQLFTQHHTQDLQDLQRAGTNLKVCCLLQVGSGELRVMLGEKKIRNHKQLPSPSGPSCSALSLRAQLYLSLGVFPSAQATRELRVQKFFPTASHGY